ncbi:hypothetical protein BS50DRAFT_597886 [Corynespora cassiicola Philippines]|uniref:Flavin reductase like domain-containing protein n=1 Tax=Corynespora cassiicola Philippines TaxID=1448308 RepID=A0A2T2NZR7_CORCC|nr:hypothetical protein BS50DRAFT_597886 [Corynespora cassiicola Philippines]
MYFEPGKTDHGLPYHPFKACVVPRPIGWISTISPTGKANLAPYSQFNNLTFDPPYVMFAANTTPNGGRKDTTINAEKTGNAEWTEYGVDEFEKAGLRKDWSQLVLEGVEEENGNFKVPVIADSPVRFECEYHSTLRLPGTPPMGTVDVVIGRVVSIHVNDGVITDGKVDIRKTRPIARCGYWEYTVVESTFEMRIPGDNKAVLGGLEGSSQVNQNIKGDAREGKLKEGTRCYEGKIVK